jgi:hypothetical protein
MICINKIRYVYQMDGAAFSASFTRTEDDTGTRSRKWERSGTSSLPLPLPPAYDTTPLPHQPALQVPPVSYPISGKTVSIEIPAPLPLHPNIQVMETKAVVPHGTPIDPVSLIQLLQSGIRAIYIEGQRGFPGEDGKPGNDAKGAKGDEGKPGGPGEQGPRGPPCDCKNILYGKRHPTRIIRGRGNRTIDIMDEYIIIDTKETVTLTLPDLSKMVEPDDYNDFYIESKVYNVMCYTGIHNIRVSSSTPDAKINGYLTEYRIGNIGSSSTKSQGFIGTAKIILTDNGGWVIV